MITPQSMKVLKNSGQEKSERKGVLENTVHLEALNARFVPCLNDKTLAWILQPYSEQANELSLNSCESGAYCNAYY